MKLAGDHARLDAGDELESIISRARNPEGGPEEEPSFGMGALDQISSAISSLQRFMNSLSK